MLSFVFVFVFLLCRSSDTDVNLAGRGVQVESFAVTHSPHTGDLERLTDVP